MKKKLLFFVMTFFVVCLLAISASAVEVDGIYYSFTNTDAYPGYDGTATVTSENRTSGTLTEVIIPEIVEYDSDSDGVADKRYIVTEIAGSAFGSTGGSNHPAVSLFVPKTVKSIGTHAFRQLQHLQTVVIEARGYNPSTGEDWTAEINFTNGEFYSCPNLLSVDMSNSNVVQLGDHSFISCSKMHTFLFSKNIKRIYSAFNSCSSLTTININSLESLEEIGRGFYNTKISGDIKCPKLKSLGESAFRETNITSIDFTGSTFTAVSGHSFKSCSSLESVILPDTVTTIGSEVFRSCSSLKSINECPALTSIGSFSFSGCSSLTSFVFPNGLTTIYANAFQSTKLTSVILPESLTTTEKDIFNSCPVITAIVPADVAGFTSTLFSSCSALKVIIYTGSADSLTIDNGKLSGFQISQINGAVVDSFENYDPSATYSTKTIFTDAKRSANDYRVMFSFNGFDKSFSAWNALTNTKTEYSSIFEASGYSMGPNSTGIATGFKVNHDSLEAYEALVGKKVTFGVVVFNPKYLNADTFFTSEGLINASKGALQVTLDLTYTNCNLSVSGMSLDNADHASLELIFAGYAFTDDASKAQLFQKEYIGSAESSVSSPMASKVTRGADVLYTVKLQSVLTPAQISTGKEGLTEY